MPTDANDARGAGLASYLLFEPGYIRALMALGRKDTFAQREEVVRFFQWNSAVQAPASSAREAACA